MHYVVLFFIDQDWIKNNERLKFFELHFQMDTDNRPESVLTSTSEISENSAVIIPMIPTKNEEENTDSDTVAMAPISPRANTARQLGANQGLPRVSTGRNQEKSCCCNLI